MLWRSVIACAWYWSIMCGCAVAAELSESDATTLQTLHAQLAERVSQLARGRNDLRPVADVELFAKAAEWALRHQEFPEPACVGWTKTALETGLARADSLAMGVTAWFPRVGSTVLGYYSRIDDSVQPLVLTLPADYQASDSRSWPLQIELHGRGDTLNEVRFIHQHEGRALKEPIGWVQLDVYGRGNNAYRWAGETDVFEALAEVKRRIRIDERRITLRGFSMGGAGAWHLGLHYPSLWSSVGAGAGFVDTVHHLSLDRPLSPLEQKMVHIYDAQDYALNAFDVPVITYGGDMDVQLFAGRTMHARGEELGITIPLLIGEQTAHRWHPERWKQFMSFHAEHSRAGRPVQRSHIKFTTYTPKYPRCEWLTIEEQNTPYEQSIVDAAVDDDGTRVRIETRNVALLQVLRDVAESVVIDDGEPLPLSRAAGNLLPGVYFEKLPTGWVALDEQQSHRYAAHENRGDQPHKRHNLQGPIDDALMEPFVCVRPTGAAWSPDVTDWSKWTLDRFEREFDRWLRAKVPVVKDTQLTDELIASKNLILFGDPGSNAVIAKVVGKLPVKWTRESIEMAGRSWNTQNHAVAMIYPNPLNPRKYVVINSGHTFHAAEFRASNATLYPRLGDIAVIRFAAQPDGEYHETVSWADLFDAHWSLGVH